MSYTLINRETGDAQYNAPVSFYTSKFIYMIDGTALDRSKYSVKIEYGHDYDIVLHAMKADMRDGKNNYDVGRMYNSTRHALFFRRMYLWHKRVNHGHCLQFVINSKNEKVLSS